MLVNAFGPTAILELPTPMNPPPSATSSGFKTDCTTGLKTDSTVNPARISPVENTALLVLEERGPGNATTPPGATMASSKSSTSSPGDARLNAVRVSKVMSAAFALVPTRRVRPVRGRD